MRKNQNLNQEREEEEETKRKKKNHTENLLISENPVKENGWQTATMKILGSNKPK